MAHARSQILRARNTDQSNPARAVEESIREGLLGETMLSPDPAYSEHIYRRGRELAGPPPLPTKGETMMVDPDENGLEPETDEDIQGSE
ncbi:hypothetical protein CKO28_02855 [Rhodovibrio sodomensis]|uniref:Uncharacterized protein n=1 Tax=Rhodovibrio sodomensis TaxID=1088 RepID=A0ABS1DAP4_9PROT|nr:hypothetical protein [Rhodovibrio sodomensis]MBK1666982.1 hypothetical protein [Rhodovibrio sodomensis]